VPLDTVRRSVAPLSLSVVVPVFNEASHLQASMDALATALERGGLDAEVVLVDDGSNDGSADVARAALEGRVPLRVLSQPNRGRYEARRAGIAASGGEYVLLLDARVRLAPRALQFVRDRLESGESVWNGHVDVETDSMLGIFWRLLAELAWRDYFDRPRTTSFGVREFDRYPKGTTCFLAPRPLLTWAFGQLTTRYADVRFANDDTPILRRLAGRERIGISPQFSCVYSPRTTLGRFLRHSIHRGTVFLDGHGTRESRFFPLVVAFFPLSTLFVVTALRRPAAAPAALAAVGLVAGLYGHRAGRSRREVQTLLVVTPVYAVGHGLGMWRGLGKLARGRLPS
jgi:glycosyltransferase involved in cell wall biosynthesis